MSKKAVSPLIATVLLLAFAVALATVIININPFGGCKAKVQISKINDAERICYDEIKGVLEIFISNEDTTRGVEGFLVRISGQEDTSNQESPQPIGPLTEQKVTVPYDAKTFGRILNVKISPKVNISGRSEVCDMAEVPGPIPACT